MSCNNKTSSIKGKHCYRLFGIPTHTFGSIKFNLIFVNKKSHCNPYIVVIQCDSQDSETAARSFLEENTKRCVVKSKTVQKGCVELNLEVRLKGDNTDFINTLCEMPGVQSAVLVSYNGDYMG